MAGSCRVERPSAPLSLSPNFSKFWSLLSCTSHSLPSPAVPTEPASEGSPATPGPGAPFTALLRLCVGISVRSFPNLLPPQLSRPCFPAVQLFRLLLLCLLPWLLVIFPQWKMRVLSLSCPSSVLPPQWPHVSCGFSHLLRPEASQALPQSCSHSTV